jgi:hypothetical protein
VANGENNRLGLANKAAKLSVYNATTLALVITYALPTDGIGHGYVEGCVFNTDDGLVYIAGNDENADGGDVIWVVNPLTELPSTRYAC